MGYTKKELKDLICRCCGRAYKNRYSKSEFCSDICRHNHWNKTMSIDQTIYSDSVSRSTVGSISELKVCCDLMIRGYAVYKSISPNCHADLVAIKNDKVYQIEVRTAKYNHGGKLTFPKKRSDGKSVVAYTYKDDKIHYLTNPELGK